MSTITCVCGNVYRDDGHLRARAILLDLPELARLEAETARTIVEFFAQTGIQRDVWLHKYFGRDYPIDLTDEEIVHDLISKQVNLSDFSSIFLCPGCGRLAVASGYDQNSWSFFLPE